MGAYLSKQISSLLIAVLFVLATMSSAKPQKDGQDIAGLGEKTFKCIGETAARTKEFFNTYKEDMQKGLEKLQDGFEFLATPLTEFKADSTALAQTPDNFDVGKFVDGVNNLDVVADKVKAVAKHLETAFMAVGVVFSLWNLITGLTSAADPSNKQVIKEMNRHFLKVDFKLQAITQAIGNLPKQMKEVSVQAIKEESLTNYISKLEEYIQYHDNIMSTDYSVDEVYSHELKSEFQNRYDNYFLGDNSKLPSQVLISLKTALGKGLIATSARRQIL
eukprot:Pgem_evm2s19487